MKRWFEIEWPDEMGEGYLSAETLNKILANTPFIDILESYDGCRATGRWAKEIPEGIAWNARMLITDPPTQDEGTHEEDPDNLPT